MLLIVPVAHQLGIGGILWPVFHLCYCVKLMKWSQTCLGCCYIISLLKLHWYSFHFNRLGLRKPFSVELFGYQSGGCLKNEDLSLLNFFIHLELSEFFRERGVLFWDSLRFLNILKDYFFKYSSWFFRHHFHWFCIFLSLFNLYQMQWIFFVKLYV